ncbi:BLUF domain-containing protein [Limibacter armeniacum]|uniref:BLUF domain-containing protein n=1 Tax=Limibacter armeniacum TaxID=466084 RepID=UPI002FE55B77
MKEDLYCIVYVSEQSIPYDMNMLIDLADISAIKNISIGITGFLYYDKGYFFQYLEGDRKYVEQLMSKIKSDPTHRFINLKEVLPSKDGKRRFPHWSMRLIKKEFITSITMENVIMEYMLSFKEAGLEFNEHSNITLDTMLLNISKFQSKYYMY